MSDQAKASPTKLFITGATGFIGRAVCQEAVKRGMPVTGSCRNDVNLPAGITGIRISTIDELTDWDIALKDIDVVIHLAARAHIMHETANDPLQEFRRTNTVATLHLARSAAAAGVRRFVFISSIKVNGEHTLPGHPFTETDTPHPEDIYGLSKWEAEQGLIEIGKSTGMEIVIIRPPLVYGPGVKGNFAQLLRVIAKRLPLPLASIRNRRSLIYLENLVDAILLCATHPDAANQTYLVSDGTDISSPELIRKISQHMQHGSRLFPCPTWLLGFTAKLAGKRNQFCRLNDSLQINPHKISAELGWHPPYSLDEGLHETSVHFPGKPVHSK